MQYGHASCSIFILGSFFVLSTFSALGCRDPKPLKVDAQGYATPNRGSLARFHVSGGNKPYVASLSGTNSELRYFGGGSYAVETEGKEQTIVFTVKDARGRVATATVHSAANLEVDRISDCQPLESKPIVIHGGFPPYTIEVRGSAFYSADPPSINTIGVTSPGDGVFTVTVTDRAGSVASTEGYVYPASDVYESLAGETGLIEIRNFNVSHEGRQLKEVDFRYEHAEIFVGQNETATPLVTEIDGVKTLSLRFPIHPKQPAGMYKLQWLTLIFDDRSRLSLSTKEKRTLSLVNSSTHATIQETLMRPTVLIVHNDNEDLDPPQVLDAKTDKHNYTVGETIRITVRLKQSDASGAHASAEILGPTTFRNYGHDLVLNAEWVHEIDIPENTEPGTYAVRLALMDGVGNYVAFSPPETSISISR